LLKKQIDDNLLIAMLFTEPDAVISISLCMNRLLHKGTVKRRSKFLIYLQYLHVLKFVYNLSDALLDFLIDVLMLRYIDYTIRSVGYRHTLQCSR